MAIKQNNGHGEAQYNIAALHLHKTIILLKMTDEQMHDVVPIY